MEKILLCVMMFALVSCDTVDEITPIEDTNAISFNFNGVEYFSAEYNVLLNPTNIDERIIEVSFDNDTKSILFVVVIEETNQIEEFVLIENGIHYISDPILGDRETSITTHTDSKMEGTFRVTIEDTLGNPKYVITNGVIDIAY